MKVTIRDLNKTLINVLNSFIGIRGFNNIEARCEDIFTEEADGLVSPANSFGHMDGGIDQAYLNRFGNSLEADVKEEIALRPMKELLIGETIVIPLDKEDFDYLIVAPTMREPGPIRETIDVYLSSKAAFIAAKSMGFSKLVMPGMGTLTGRVREDIAANHMLTAYKEVFGRDA
jgi:O-acetyl-ADP-ribose deacetylase (regulator of RNase III)